MRLIDADVLDFDGMSITQIVDAVQDAETVDAEPVTRCKDCESYRMIEGANNKKAHICALGFGLKGLIAANDFCSYGKRKENT